MKFLLPLLLALAVQTVTEPSAHAATKPNILWLVAEDMGPALGCYGQKEVSTPNLDRLASEGIRYTRAYTTAPVCSASRSAFMTGMYQVTIGAHNHRSHRDDGFMLPEGVRPIPLWMHDAGYFTANLVDLPKDFDFKGTGKTDWNFTEPPKPFDSKSWDDLKGHQPFFAQINFQETHRNYHAPPHADPAKVAIPPYYPDHPVTREDYAKYLDAATELDRKIGLILAQLEKEGLTENTLVLFQADHGESMVRGKQFCYEEGLHIPLIVRWPKHIEPGQVSDRMVAAIDFAPTFLSAAGAPIPPKMEGRVFFGDQATPPRDLIFGARDRCDETAFRFRAVRDERYRYIHNFTPERPFLQPNDYKRRQYPVWTLLPKLNAEGKLTPPQAALCAPTMPPEELYDLQADPHEIKNLASDPTHADTLKRLRAAVDRWIADTHDQGAELEPEWLVKAKGATKAKH
jgi:arylsulfatase A-like enzyme